MSVIEMLPVTLREKLNILPDPEKFVIRTLEDALNKYKKHTKSTQCIRGKYKSVPTGSDEFSRRKQNEIRLER